MPRTLWFRNGIGAEMKIGKLYICFFIYKKSLLCINHVKLEDGIDEKDENVIEQLCPNQNAIIHCNDLESRNIDILRL